MRRVLVLAAMAALIIGAIPSVASAARAQRFEEDGLAIACLFVSEEGGTTYTVAQVSSEFGGFAGLAWWAPGVEPFQDLPTLISNENTVTAAVDGNSMDATMELYVFVQPDPDDPEGNPYGEPAGQATLSAVFEPLGEPTTYVEESQGTNAKFRSEVTQQELAATGAVTMPGATFDDLSKECQAARQHVSYFATSPSTRIERSSGIGMTCEWTDADRHVLLFANTEGSEFTHSELMLSDASGDYFSLGEASLTTESFIGRWELRSMGPGGEIVPEAVGGELFGTAAASAALTPTGEGDRVIDRSHGQMMKFVYEVLAVSGELTVVTEAGQATLPMDAEHCTANTADVQARFSSPKGAGGRPLRNDLPENARPIAIGESVSVRNAGAALEPEAPCRIFFEEIGEEVEMPISHTGWWTVTGTGGDVTVDTTGSDFDTIVGIYVQQDGEMVQVGCVDDVASEEGGSLQAVITFASEADTTYHVQAGGFGDSTGQLVLSVR